MQIGQGARKRGFASKNPAKEKQAAAQQTFVFLVCINEQTSDEIGQGAREQTYGKV